MSRHCILIVLLGVWVSLWTAGSAVSQAPAGVDDVHPAVRRLLEPEHRNAAFAEILSWPKNLFKTTQYRPLDLDVVDVVVCPQRDEPPLYAVLTDPESSHPRITLLDQDGTVLPLHPDGKGIRYRLGDVNGDQVLDMVGTQPIWMTVRGTDVSFEALFVVPLTRESQPLLMVLMNAKFEQRLAFPRWSWRFRETAPGVQSVELGPRIPGEKGVETKVVYDWSDDLGRYVGPPGDPVLPFLRVQGAESKEVRFFAREAFERGRRQAQEASEEPRPLDTEDALHVGGDVQPPRKIDAPQPQYTKEARKARVQGVVIAQVIIDQEGNVKVVKVLKGLSMGLTEMAVEAMSKWKFEPATLNGEPVEVYYNLTVNFRLQ